jgi:alpha-tubulin suppressor-like RCC1 family protein
VRVVFPAGPPPKVVAASIGEGHTLAIDSTGAVWGWGFNTAGQLGDANTSTRLSAEKLPMAFAGSAKVVGVYAGAEHSLVLDSEGRVFGWGRNDFGQLGDNTVDNKTSAIRVNLGLPNGVSLRQMTVGDGHALLVATDHSLRVWGYNGGGQLGVGNFDNLLAPFSPAVFLPMGQQVVSIGTGQNHTLYLASSGRVWATGYNEFGQLGSAPGFTFENTPFMSALILPGSRVIRSLSSGGRHSLAEATDGTVWAWGSNDSGQLGIGSQFTTPNPAPVQVNGLSLRRR